MDFANLPLDEVIVVDQPFGRRGDRAALIDRSGNRAVGMQQNGAVVGEAAGQRMTPDRLRRDRLRGRKATRVRLQALDAEQLFANGFAAVPRRGGRSAPKDAVNDGCQFDLSAARCILAAG